jgi:lactate dehydrogenase-like 2-hydroxyacid dehydrogenase
MANKIVFLDASTVGLVSSSELISSLGDYTSYDLTLPAQTIERIGNNNIVITNKVVIDKNTIDSCPTLKLICIAATGMNNVDLDYAATKGIVVKNVAGYSTNSVAQHTFAALFNLIHKINYYDQYVKSGQYSESQIFTNHQFPFFELNGKQFGIIGLGSIGKKVASIAEAFGAKVVYYSTSEKNKDAYYHRVSMDELLSTSDIISIHCPLNEKTLNLIGEDQFNSMKSSAIMINVGRGGIVNENALANAVDSRRISGAIIDVFSNEPIKSDNPLMKIKLRDNILFTPHIAWASMEARELLIEKTANNIRKFIAGQG